jgi:hypothetical protein
LDRSTTPAPGVSDTPGNGSPGTQQYYQGMPKAGTSFQRQLQPITPGLSSPASAPPAVKFEKIVSLPNHNIEGQVVRENQGPQANAKVLFVRAERQGDQQSITANESGQFRATLASGGWLVYVHGADGKPVFYSKIDVKDNDQPRQFTLVSR